MCSSNAARLIISMWVWAALVLGCTCERVRKRHSSLPLSVHIESSGNICWYVESSFPWSCALNRCVVIYMSMPAWRMSRPFYVLVWKICFFGCGLFSDSRKRLCLVCLARNFSVVVSTIVIDRLGHSMTSFLTCYNSRITALSRLSVPLWTRLSNWRVRTAWRSTGADGSMASALLIWERRWIIVEIS